MNEYSDLILCKDEMPPDDYEYTCSIVFSDGYESLSDGGTIHDTFHGNEQRIKGWKRKLTPLEMKYRESEKEVKRLRESLEQIMNCEEGARDMWEIACEALAVPKG